MLFQIVVALLPYFLVFLPNDAFLVAGSSSNGNQTSTKLEHLDTLLKYEQRISTGLEHRIDTIEQLYKLKFADMENDYRQHMHDLQVQQNQSTTRQSQMMAQVTNMENNYRQHMHDLQVQLNQSTIKKNQMTAQITSLQQTVNSQEAEILRLKNDSFSLHTELGKLTTQTAIKSKDVIFRALLVRSMDTHVYQKVVFDRVFLKLGHAYDSSSGTFIAPFNGMYLFHVQAHTISGRWQYLMLRHERNVIGYVFTSDKIADWHPNSITAGTYMHTGESVWAESSGYIAGTQFTDQTSTTGLNTIFTGLMLTNDKH